MLNNYIAFFRFMIIADLEMLLIFKFYLKCLLESVDLNIIIKFW